MEKSRFHRIMQDDQLNDLVSLEPIETALRWWEWLFWDGSILAASVAQQVGQVFLYPRRQPHSRSQTSQIEYFLIL